MQKNAKLFHGDISLWIIYFFFGIISLVEVYSATSQLTYRSTHYYSPIIAHAVHLLLGAGVAWFVHWLPWKYFKRIGPVFLILSLFGLALLTFTNLGTTGAGNSGARWFSIMGINFQPSEFAKMFLVMYVALVLTIDHGEKGSRDEAYKEILVMAVPTCALIAAENISTAGILWFVVLSMMIIGRVPWKQWGALLGGTVLFIVVGFGTLKALPQESPIYDLPMLGRVQTAKMRLERKFSKITPDNVQDYDFDQIRQRVHANTAIANANFIGRMPGNSRERDSLSQAYSDFIFAIILEETGLWGGAIVILLYLMLLLRVGKIASQCERCFPAFMIMGLVIMICLQALINMLVAVDSFFITGQPLPFISRGGTSLLVSGIEMGIFLSVSRYVRRLQREKESASSALNPGLQVDEHSGGEDVAFEVAPVDNLEEYAE